MSKLLRIAGREYLSYVRTVGFWLSMLVMPVGFAAVGVAPQLVERSSPPPALAVIDLSGQHLDRALDHLFDGGPGVIAPAPPEAMGVTDPKALGAILRPYLVGDKQLPGGGRLDSAVVLHRGEAGVAADLWTSQVADRSLETKVGAALADAVRRERLAAAGVAPAELDRIEALQPKVTVYSPKAAGVVGLRERLPGIVGFGMGFLLWMAVMTGAGILLNSVIEEKSSRIIEVLLASASVPQIMGGKILGVAMVSATVIGVWLTLGLSLLAHAAPEAARQVMEVMTSNGLLLYFALYFAGGYLMYAAIFATVGAFCETTREAQTLLGPVMILLAVPMVFMSQAISRPDAPILAALAWVPLFTPFLMAARAAASPPAWQVAATLAEMAATTALVLWLCGRAFRTGALSSGRFEWKTLLAGLRGGEA